MSGLTYNSRGSSTWSGVLGPGTLLAATAPGQSLLLSADHHSGGLRTSEAVPSWASQQQEGKAGGGECQASPGPGDEAETRSGHRGARDCMEREGRAGPWRAVPRTLGCAAQHAMPGAWNRSPNPPQRSARKQWATARSGEGTAPHRGACMRGI